MDFRLLSSRCVGALADLPVPRFLRGPFWRVFARTVGADLDEVELPLDRYRSLTDFFVRRLRADVRPVDRDPAVLPSPVDGAVQSVERIGPEGSALQAKGQSYGVEDLLAGAADEPLEGWMAWTLYLSPKDYHRIHAPFDARVVDVRWVEGERHPVAPRVLAKRPRVFVRNARVVLRLATATRAHFIVLVGALNVSRIRLEGAFGPGLPDVQYRRGEELGRFELGSTVILVTPPGGPVPNAGLAPGAPVRVGRALGRCEDGAAL